MADWEATAAQKRSSILSSFPLDFPSIKEVPSRENLRNVLSYIEKYLSSTERSITHSSVSEILTRTASGAWTAQAVTLAFCKRAALAHQLTNCLHEAFFSAALADAEALDSEFARTGRPKGPLHGLPISLKDQLHVRGVETSLGLVGWIGTFEGRKGTGKEKNVESEMARLLRDAGAILFCKTAVPQASMAGVTENNIIDYVWNPFNRLVSAGGSSGGEGALVGCKGSPLGVGTDIAASVRVPAAYNGLWGLRTSVGRLPFKGAAVAVDGQETLRFTPGPLAADVEGCKIFMKALLRKRPWETDPECVDLPWREGIRDEILGVQKLTFGVLRDDGLVKVLPPVQRAVNILSDSLKRIGHEIIEWNPPSHKTLHSIAIKALRLDGASTYHNAFAISGEPSAQVLAASYGTSPRSPSSVTAGFAINVAKREARQAYMDYWNSASQLTKTGRAVDAVIAPIRPLPAARRGDEDALSYTSWVNVLDYSSLAIPVTTVDEEVDRVKNGLVPRSESEKGIWESYDPHIYHGTPVGVQLVGKRFQEEKVLAIGEVIEGALKAFNRKKATYERL